MKLMLTERKEYTPPPSRMYFLYGVIFVGAVVIIGQLYFVQVVRGDGLRDEAEAQYVSTSATLERGSIYFTEKDGGRFGAAVLSYGFFLAMNPEFVTDPETAYEKLSKIIDLDRDRFLASAQKKGDPFEMIASRLSEEDAEKIRSLSLPGLSLYPDSWRFYPGQTTASQLIGYYGYGESGKGGMYGLEQHYDDLLTPDNQDTSINIFASIFGNVGDDNRARAEQRGDYGDVYTTIEPTVQNIFEKNLKEAKDRWNAEAVSGIIMDPKTGAIYAMASLPEFNPNTYSESDISSYSNSLVSGIFEMGSIVKALTMAAGLDSGAVTPETTYYDTGSRIINGSRISNYDFKARGTTDMQNVLNHSLNLGAVFVMEQMGQENFERYFRAFGLGRKTGVDLPNEVSGLLRLDDRRKIGYATASYGQGIALSPIATIRALAALGNGGVLPNPHVVRMIDYQNNPTWKWTPGESVRVLKPETSETITRMLVTVMDDYMLGGTVDLPHYSIAAKTGTAQVAKPGGGYYENRYFHTYFGYYPAYDPKFIVFLSMTYPKEVRYASHTLTKPFMDTAKFLLNYYEVPPDR